jgi:preprotein translocase subunit YajC
MDSAGILSLVLAQAPAGNNPPAGGPGGGELFGGFFIPIVIMLGLAYFLMIRPAKKQEQERKKMIYALKRGDEVVFCGGILGTVAGIKEKTSGSAGDGDEISVRTDGNNKLRILRSSIYQVTPSSSEASESAEKSA